jgi:aryl-alcohol dehydrogenase-like predicted oxidoreductase
MEYRHLGRTGLKVSALSYGAWVSFGNQLDVKDAKVLLHRCREAGVNFFDNAELYANGRAEEIMGAAIKELGWKRSDIVISTKLFWGGQGPNDKGLSRKHIIEGIKVHTHTHTLSFSLSLSFSKSQESSSGSTGFDWCTSSRISSAGRYTERLW